jgi:hypothetical protein
VKCSDCKRQLDVGDQYIKFTVSEWAERQGMRSMPELDDLMASIMGSDAGTDIVYCEDCTVRGGDFMLETVYGDEDTSAPSPREDRPE